MQKFPMPFVAATLLLGLCNRAHADSSSDLAAVTAANNAFYSAESALDAAAMEKVWAHEDYVAIIGPRAIAPMIGWAVLQPYFAKNFGNMAQFSLKPVDAHIRVNGNTAWVVGKEEVGNTSKLKDGTPISSRPTLVTNIFEKNGERWLMVSHHAQETPQ
jgi:hypothetical protein